jgi:L-lactate dehydrogenase complex protein LldG
MSSKNSILTNIRALVMEEKLLPSIPDFEVAPDLEAAFIEGIIGNKGEVVSKSDLLLLIEKSGFKKIYSSSEIFSQYSNCALPQKASEFAELDLAIIEGQFGVAENGAIWMDDTDLGLRAVPFITAHLVIVLKRKNLVGNMHEGYKKVGLAKSGFGIFVAGPSKTADIEQSLVIGAHGAMSLRVVLT